MHLTESLWLQCPSYANLFFEKIVPEWSIALIMAKFGMMREDVVEKIQKQKPNHSQIDDSQSIYVTQDSINEHFWRSKTSTQRWKRKTLWSAAISVFPRTIILFIGNIRYIIMYD